MTSRSRLIVPGIDVRVAVPSLHGATFPGTSGLVGPAIRPAPPPCDRFILVLLLNQDDCE